MCRRSWLLASLPVLVWAWPAFLRAQPGRETPRPISPQDHVTLAGAFLKANWPYSPVYEQDRSWNRDFIRFISFYSTPEADLSTYRRYLAWWTQQLSFERAVSLPVDVPDSQGRLVWVDLRWYGWNARAWQAVAEREPYFREPWLLFEDTDYLRRQTGHKTGQVGKDGTRHALAIVRGDWFIRETLETRRSTSYYDLLYSRFRFPEKRVYSGGKWYRESQPFVDFPRDITDWEKAFGVDVIKAFGKEREVSLDYGAIVAGGRDYPGEGSIVTLHNRLIVIHDVPFGKDLRTYDVFETSGDRDYSERLFFNGKRFRKGDGADATFDAGELLSYLPNGGQAGLLIDGKGKRIEVAGGDAANDTADKTLNQGVRTNGSCVTCHGTTGGFIPPRNLEEISRQAGVQRKFKDQDQSQRYSEFFFDWLESMEGVQKRYQALVTKTTAPTYAGFLDLASGKQQPWTGADVAAQTGHLRSQYDAPVNLQRAARELGVPEGLAGYLCNLSALHRAKELQRGQKIPSTVWERDTFRELGLQLAAQRGKQGEY